MPLLAALLVLQTGGTSAPATARPAGGPRPGQRREASRISVKRGSDAGAKRMSRKVVPTTLEHLLSLRRPSDLPADTRSTKYESRRAAPLETTVWSVKARIKEIVLREDGDFYMVIEGANGGRTVAECPDPKLCVGSAYLKELKKTRAALEAKFHPTKQVQRVDVPVTLVGVGYFGFQGRRVPAGAPIGSAAPHAAPDALPHERDNGARLMPLIGVRF